MVNGEGDKKTALYARGVNPPVEVVVVGLAGDLGRTPPPAVGGGLCLSWPK